jgi:hypothetical protein
MTHMNHEHKKHSTRFAVVLALAVVALVVISFDQLRSSALQGGEQQAAVLKMYAE